jgi:hypothetical protein
MADPEAGAITQTSRYIVDGVLMPQGPHRAVGVIVFGVTV